MRSGTDLGACTVICWRRNGQRASTRSRTHGLHSLARGRAASRGRPTPFPDLCNALRKLKPAPVPGELPFDFFKGHVLAFSPSGALLAAGACADEPCSAAVIDLWAVPSGRLVGQLPLHVEAEFVA